jgi:hypothetical protein
MSLDIVIAKWQFPPPMELQAASISAMVAESGRSGGPAPQFETARQRKGEHDGVA